MMKAATKQTIKAVVDEAWQGGALNELKNYVRMPCKSKDFDVDWEANGFLLQVCRNAAAWGRRLFPEAVFEILTEPGRTQRFSLTFRQVVKITKRPFFSTVISTSSLKGKAGA